MRPDVKRDLTDSAHDFCEIVWPRIANYCGGGELIRGEGSSEKLATLLDLTAGTDYWLLRQDGRMIGLSNRCQWGEPWSSFTVRDTRTTGATTEREKNLAALDDPAAHMSGLTVQAYIDRRGGRLLHAGICYSHDLYLYIKDRFGHLHWRTNPADGNKFLVVWFNELLNAGLPVAILTRRYLYSGKPATATGDEALVWESVFPGRDPVDYPLEQRPQQTAFNISTGKLA